MAQEKNKSDLSSLSLPQKLELTQEKKDTFCRVYMNTQAKLKAELEKESLDQERISKLQRNLSAAPYAKTVAKFFDTESRYKKSIANQKLNQGNLDKENQVPAKQPLVIKL